MASLSRVSVGAVDEAVLLLNRRATRVRSPRTNGFMERMNRTLLDECFRVKGRTEWYLSPAEIRRDLDAYLEEYILRRTHQGYRVQGRTPAQALREALGVEELPPFVLAEEEPIDSEPTAAWSAAGARASGITVLVHP